MKLHTFAHWIGLDLHPLSHTERWLAATGAFCGILATALISHHYLPAGDAWLMVGSMGASAVLLFAVPHGQLSQPWAATGGQLISAAVGVACAQTIPVPELAAAAAVALSVLAMHYARCIHPPGGATALIAVIGGPTIHALGYRYVIEPVMINALTILAMAFVFNNLFSWRRYPAFVQRHRTPAAREPQVAPEDIAHALQHIDSPIDATDEDLLEIVQQANAHARKRNGIHH